MIVRESPIGDIVRVNRTVKEFTDTGTFDEEYFLQRCQGKTSLFLCAYEGDEPIGYSVWYDKEGDGAFYCWMAGVNPEYRRKGILSAMIDFGIDFAQKRGYSHMTIKTRNSRREMLSYLVSHGFCIVSVEPAESVQENRLLFSKDLALKQGKS